MVCTVYMFLLITRYFTNCITVCSKYSREKIAKREIIKRLFCHVIHGDMTSQLDITWQRGETIAKYLFISIWKLANGMAQNHISGVNLSALYIRRLIYLWTWARDKNKTTFVVAYFPWYFTRRPGMETTPPSGSWFPCWAPREVSWKICNNHVVLLYYLSGRKY